MPPKKQEEKPIVPIDILCKQLQKKMGKNGLIVCIDEGYTLPSVEVIDTGICTLNEALGIMGWPVGRIIELYGAPSSGKTTLSLRAIAEAQKRVPDKRVAIIDNEHSFDKEWAKVNGVDCSKIIFAQPDSAENTLDILEALSETGAVSVAMIDSVAGMVPKAELEGNMEDQQMGLMARIMSKGLRKITGKAAKSGTTIFFINQVRSGIGPYASPEVTPGGAALRFHSSIRVKVKRRSAGEIKSGGEVIGQEIEAHIVKNKMAAPFKVAVIPLYFASGFSDEHALVTASIMNGIITKSGSWLSWKDQQVQGTENFARLLEQNKQVRLGIRTEYEDMIKARKVIRANEEESNEDVNEE